MEESLDLIRVPDRAGWRAWLAEHHRSRPEDWLLLTK